MRALLAVAAVVAALTFASTAHAVTMVGAPVFGPGLRDHGSICSYITFGRCTAVNDFSWVWAKS